MVTGPPSGARAVARCDMLGVGRFSDSASGLYRPYLGPAHRATIDQVATWMAEAGMTTRLDAAANLIGRVEGSDPDTPTLLIGSHLDSVTDAGRYDGPLGVMLGIDCVERLLRPSKFAIEVIGFGDEEGSRFPASMLCSRAVAGTLDEDAPSMTGRDGMTLADAFAGFGLDLARIRDAARAPGSVFAYLEPHIEQGPVLEAEGIALGVVTGIAAQMQFEVTLTGVAGHAGTTAMGLRRDALVAAADAVLAVERAALAAGEVVATVGRLTVAPGATNVVPGRVDFTVDVRAGTEAIRDITADSVLAAIRAVGAARGVDVKIACAQALAASPCDLALTDRLARAVASTGRPVRRLVSGAGHDAMTMSALCPTAMLFIRCGGGVSHNPAEAVDVADVDAALAAMIAFVESLGHD